MNTLQAWMRAALLVCAGLLSLAGCESFSRDEKPAAEARVVASKEVVFAHAREVLWDLRYSIDRADASEGVLTTMPKNTSGLATPWDREQRSFEKELEDLMHQQSRRVRVTLAKPQPKEGVPTDGITVLTVDCWIERQQRPDARPHARMPGVVGTSPDATVAPDAREGSTIVSRDDAHARAIVDAIVRRCRDQHAQVVP